VQSKPNHLAPHFASIGFRTHSISLDWDWRRFHLRSLASAKAKKTKHVCVLQKVSPSGRVNPTLVCKGYDALGGLLALDL
jgi:hypothetical protein